MEITWFSIIGFIICVSLVVFSCLGCGCFDNRRDFDRSFKGICKEFRAFIEMYQMSN
jgi:hypothetical protein